jgi:hypothetical protein
MILAGMLALIPAKSLVVMLLTDMLALLPDTGYWLSFY